MGHLMEAQTHAATGLLARMLFGLTETVGLPTTTTETPDFTMDEITETAPGAMSAKVILPTGDTYLVTVAWLSEDSP